MDILVWNVNGCLGMENGGCYVVEVGVCCIFNGVGGVLFNNLLIVEMVIFYIGGGCMMEVVRFEGLSFGVCYYEYVFFGVKWVYSN